MPHFDREFRRRRAEIRHEYGIDDVVDPAAPQPVAIETTTLLGAARDNGRISAGRAGNKVEIRSPPTPVFTLVGGPGHFSYLRDLRPDQNSHRLVNLSAEEDRSSTTTLVTSYETQDAREVIPGGLETEMPGMYERSHMLQVYFGAGTAAHRFEVDVCEGNVVTVPGSHLEVTLVDYTWHRSAPINAALGTIKLETQAHAASYANVVAGTATCRVYTPLQVEIDLADPPTLEQHLTALCQALIERQVFPVETP